MTDPIDDAIQEQRDEILGSDDALTDTETDLVLTTREDMEDESDGPEPSCMNCAHRDVCAVLNRVGAVLGEALNAESPEDLPIDPVDLAVICDKYDPEE